MEQQQQQQNILILDGGMSRELIRLKAPFQQPEWSAQALISGPQGHTCIKQVHTEFIAAGADIITTNSYALVPFHIGEDRFRTDGERLAQLAGRLARSAADEHKHNDTTTIKQPGSGRRKVRVAGSLPPIFGSYESDRFDDAQVQQYLEVLVQGLEQYVDIWLGETLSLIAEAEAVLVAVRSTGKPVWISFTLDDNDNNEKKETTDSGDSKGHSTKVVRLRSGQSVAEAARWAITAKIECLLFNCSQPEIMGRAIRQAKEVVSQQQAENQLSIGVYANAFVKVARESAANEGLSSTRDELSPEAYADFARQWIEDGATVVGGCCGIGCEHIRELQSLAQYR